ncbi:MAG: type II toxin-antitoxin system Phd/YefM family antitoxin [Micromonosporaceae bacterium]
MSATEARVHFGEVLDDVAKKGDVVIIERSGRPSAVIVSVESWKHWHGRPEDPWDKMDRIFRESDEEMTKYPPDHFAGFDVDEEINVGHE